MFKRLAILGIAGIVFVLGANYLLVYTLKQQVTRERERQDQNYWGAYNAIVQFGQHPDSTSEQRAKAALDEASRKGLSKARAKILQNYLEDLERRRASVGDQVARRPPPPVFLCKECGSD